MSDYEKTYCETEFSGSHASRVEPSCRALPRPPTTNVAVRGSEPPINKKTRRGLIIAGAVVAFIIVGLLVALLVQFHVFSPKQQMKQEDRTPANCGQPGGNVQNSTKENAVDRPTSTAPTAFPDAQSCLDLKNRGITDDGIYEVKPEYNIAPTQTYCDMTTDGGGWTLVASIHESEISRKCYPDDLWSVYQHGSAANESPVKSNWENDLIFGNVQRSTTADFKHAGFFAMNAADVMVWHVPNDAPTHLWKERSTLRYRTNNGFLQSNGGNIAAIYKNNFPLRVSSEYMFTTMVLDALSLKGEKITKIFSNFYNYSYSQSYPNAIPDPDMYLPMYYGNRVAFYTAGRCIFSEKDYGTDHKCAGLPTTFGTRKSKPFFAVAVIFNSNRRIPYYYFQLHSKRPYVDPNDETIFRNATMRKGNLKLQYEIVQYRNSSYVTTCQYYFVISNEKDWASVEPSRFYRASATNSRYHKTNQYYVEGFPANIILGYTLLAISSGGEITQDQSNKVGEMILNAVESLKTLFVGTGPPGLLAQIVFDKGSNDEVMNMVPPNMRPFSEPGFLQFRAYNASGYPSAFCPGIKVFSLYPEYVCIGSISNSVEDHGTCGDYAGWEGLSTDDIQTDDASGFAHSHKDISSTILIFQR